MQVRAGELLSSLHQIQAEGFTGITEFSGITSDLVSPGQSQPPALKFLLVFQAGALTYTGSKILSPLEFAQWLRHKMQLAHMESTLQVVTTRIKNPDSVRELIEFIARFGLIKWDDLEALMQKEAAIFLEQVLPYPGVFKHRSNSNFDLSYGDDRHGLDLAKVQQTIEKRQKVWRSLAPEIDLNTKPVSRSENITSVPATVLPHLNRWLTGQFKLSEIASACREDPLQLAQAYLTWSQQGWLNLDNEKVSPPTKQLETANPTPTPAPHASGSRPIILSVDDSKIVQTMISRAIGDLYNVQLANNAIDALNILHSQKVAVLLLDVTMPDMDGLELCRNIRALPQFRQLPIVMLTAKDGLLDKVKGQFAGATLYLAKPVDREKLLPVLEKYIPKTVKAK
jgi:CheY-like chemotaxis protein